MLLVCVSGLCIIVFVGCWLCLAFFKDMWFCEKLVFSCKLLLEKFSLECLSIS